VEVSRQLEVPEMLVVVNKVPDFYNTAEIIDNVGKAYHCEVAAVIPHSDDMMALASSGIFVDQRPEHPVSFAVSEIVKKVRPI
jgi:MinD-like ATPase involved in chromosome partitioning or flagellar assembly